MKLQVPLVIVVQCNSQFISYSIFLSVEYISKMPTPRGATTSVSKRGQILGYSMLDGPQRMTLAQISEKTGIGKSTCSNIIRTAKERARENGIADLCAMENLVPLPNSLPGSNQALTDAEKTHLVETALRDAEHCRMTFSQLAEAGMLSFFSFPLIE